MDFQKFKEFFEKNDRLGSLLGGNLTSLSETECLYEYTPKEEHYNPNNILHGGALFTVMDSSQGAFVHSTLDPIYKFAATGTATIRFNAPVRKGTIKIRTWLKGTDRRKLFVNSSAFDEEGKEVATLEEIWIAVLK
jgi:uncharacterized protein (TIGR00369 family)